MQRVDQEPCFILHLRAYRDTSAIIDVLSEQYGRLSLVAKGVRGGGKARQAWRAALQPFNLCQLSWQGRGELKNLIDTQAISRVNLTGESTFCGFYLNELIERTLHRFDPHPQVFSAYQQCLFRLSQINPDTTAKRKMALALREFELCLLEEVGYGLYLDQCFDTGDDVKAAEQYCYIPEQGLRLLQVGDSGAIAGAHVLAVSARDWSYPGALQAARHLTHRALSPLLGDRPLQSRRYFQ